MLGLELLRETLRRLSHGVEIAEHGVLVECGCHEGLSASCGGGLDPPDHLEDMSEVHPVALHSATASAST